MFQPDPIELKTAKYFLIKMAETISNALEQILVEQKKLAVNGYMDVLAKGYKERIISEDLFHKLKPFFEFRNKLVHPSRRIDGKKLIANIQTGKSDLNQFIKELERYITQQTQQTQ